MRQNKFRRPHYDRSGNFVKFTYWGFLDEDRTFTAPANISGLVSKDDEQFFGRTDRNKKEIFFGDNLKFNDGATAVVVWDEVSIGLQSPSGAVDRVESKRELWQSEVISNIHEPVKEEQ